AVEPIIAGAETEVTEAEPVGAETEPELAEAEPMVAEAEPELMEAEPLAAEPEPVMAATEPELTAFDEPAEQPTPAPPPEPPPEQIASGSGFAALLTFESGPFSGRIVALPNQMVSIGRAPDNDVVVGDPATSGHHGRIEVRYGSFWISDLGSTNGTQVNGEPV